MLYPKVSIIVLNYNGLKYLKNTIPILLSLNYESYEVLVVDNGSSDGSEEYLSLLKNKKLKILFNRQNLGYSAGNNIGIKNATGEYIFSIDDDIEVSDKDIIGKLLAIHNNLDDVAFISPLIKNKYDNYSTMYGGYWGYYGIKNNKKIIINKIKRKQYFEIGAPVGGAKFFRKCLFLELGGYDEIIPFYVDTDIGLRAYLKGFKNYLVTDPTIVHVGELRKTELSEWLWKYKFHFCGISSILIKNYNSYNLFISLTSFFLFSLFKAVKQTLNRKNIIVFWYYILSIVYLFRILDRILDSRKKIQGQRIQKSDLFLKIRQPEF